MSTCVWQKYDPKNWLWNKMGSDIKLRKQDSKDKYKQKENKGRIPYEYKVGDQVLLKTPRIL
jgi:hypothetical protein